MKKFLIEESGYYKISMTIEALNEEDAIDSIYGYLPRFIDVESDDREVTEVEEWEYLIYKIQNLRRCRLVLMPQLSM